MNHFGQNALTPPKSPYQIFIEENDKLLNSISQNDINSNDINEPDPILQENTDNEYYESLKESLDNINAKLGITPKKKKENKIDNGASDIEKSIDNTKAQLGSQSDILPSDKQICPSPLDKHSVKEDKRSISSKKERSSEIDNRNSNSQSASTASKQFNLKNEGSVKQNERSEDQNSYYSVTHRDQNDKSKFTPQRKPKSRTSETASRTSKNNNDIITTPTKNQALRGSQITTPDSKNDNKSIASQHSRTSISKNTTSITNNNDNNHTPNSKKANSVISSNSHTSSIKKTNSFVKNQETNSTKANSPIKENDKQTPNSSKANLNNQDQTPNSSQANSVTSIHDQTPNSPQANSVTSIHSQTPKSQKSNSVASNHSHTTGSQKGSSSVHRSTISTSYIDYLDTKQKRILERWRKEDLEEERKLEEEMIDRLLTPKHTWKTFKFTSPRSNLTSKGSISSKSNTENNNNLEEEEEDDETIDIEPVSGHVFSMPPNPSANLKQMLEIPAIERLLTPKKNLASQQSPQKTKKQNSTRPRKTRYLFEDNFVNRQAHYENEKRLKETMKSMKKPTPKKIGNNVFNSLYEKSLVNDSDSSDFENEGISTSNKTEKRNKIKWSNKSDLLKPKQIPNQQPIDPSKFRDDRYSPNSRRIAQHIESRSFQERTSIDFDDVLKQNREEQDQKKKKELYEQHMENLD